MKKIEFSDSQYKTLLKLAFLGEWVLNALAVETEHVKEKELLNLILSKNKLFNASDMVDEFDLEDSYELKEDLIMEYVDELEDYNEDIFWSLLAIKLSTRDFIEAATNENNINGEDDIDKLEYLYKKEFENEGVLNLRIVKEDSIDPKLN